MSASSAKSIAFRPLEDSFVGSALASNNIWTLAEAEAKEPSSSKIFAWVFAFLLFFSFSSGLF